MKLQASLLIFGVICTCVLGKFGACPAINTVPDVDPWTVRLPSAGFGGIITQNDGGFNDVFLYSPSKQFQIGARLDWGASITFFGLSNDTTSNVLDDHDTGREVQIALYDVSRLYQPCAQNATCGQPGSESCGTSITFLGWDPVQGGDRCDHGAKVISYGQVGDALQVVVQPVQWNPDWDSPTCAQGPCSTTPTNPVGVIYTLELRFVDENIVEVMLQIESQETYSHALSEQEFPCMYASFGENGAPDLSVLLDSDNNQIPFNPSENPMVTLFNSSKGWVSYQTPQRTYGIGLASDQGLKSFVGTGGPPGPGYFHYARYFNAFSVTAGGLMRGIAYLTLGNYATVAGLYDQVLTKRPPFGHVDLPADGVNFTYTAGQLINVVGWALSSFPSTKIIYQVDGVNLGSNVISEPRPDVCQIYPGYNGCPDIGYDYSLDTSSLDASCPHLLRVYAQDAYGNLERLGDRIIVPN